LQILSKEPEVSHREIAIACDISIGKVNDTISQLSEEEYIEIVEKR
jgi:predicted transcriptional regulator